MRHIDTLDFGDMAPNEPMAGAYKSVCNDLKTAVQNWRTINTQDLPVFNAILAKNSVAPMAAASPLPTLPACAEIKVPAASRR